MADDLRDPGPRFRARFNRVHACMEAGDIEEADRRLSEMQTLSTRPASHDTSGSTCSFIPADSACPVIWPAPRLPTRPPWRSEPGLMPPARSAAYGAVLFEIRHHQGRLDEIADLFTQAAADNPAIAALPRRCRCHVLRAGPSR